MRNFEICLKPGFEEKVLFQIRNETTKKRLIFDFCFPFLCYHFIVTFFLIIKQYM